MAAVAGPEEQVILASIRRVRSRLFVVRLAERMALAGAWAAGIGVCLVAARLVHDRFWWLGILISLVPAAGGVWLWRKRATLLPTGLLKVAAVMTVILAAGGVMAACMPWSVIGGAAAWEFAVVPLLVFAIAAGLTVKPVDARSAAIFIDQRVGLEERVSTALELLRQPATSPLEAAFQKPLIGSAIAACGQVRSAKIAYGRVDSRVYPVAASVVLAAVAAAIFLTPLPAAATIARKPYLVVAEKGKKLETILKELEKDKPPASDTAQQKLQPLKETLTQLKKGNMSPFEADAKLNEQKAELQKEQDKLDAAEKVAKAIESIKGMEELSKASEQEKNAGLKNSQQNPGAATEKQKADQNMKSAAQALADKMKGASKEDKEKMASELKSAADQAKGDPQLQKDLSAAAEDLKNGDTEKMAQDLSSAAERSGEQGAESQLTGQSLKDAMSAIDRAENNGESPSTQNSGGDSQANSGGQNGGQQQQQGGNQQQQGGDNQQQQGGNQGGQQQANGQQGGNQGGQQQGGQKNGQGMAQGNGNNGQGSENPDSGSTNMHQQGGPGHHEGGPINGAHDFVRIYDETHINSQGKTEKVSGKINPLAPAAGTADVFGQADKGDSAIQTYESQLPAAKKKALDDLQTQQIPPQYRDFVRNYYEK